MAGLRPAGGIGRSHAELTPTDTGAACGKRTGQRVTHYIIPTSRYAAAYAKLKQQGYQLRWQSRANDPQAGAKRASKTNFACEICGQNAWAKPDAVITCGACVWPMGVAR
jgi:hypothetical protein